ncbi:MAG: phage baseplate assembly protein W [Myxococcota bacterium]|jgi:phage baseplate assembly protein W
MKKLLHPSLALGAHKPYMSPEEGLVTRIQIVMETRPQQLPWNPEFGCDLSSLLGHAATPQRINEARFRIEGAVRKWLPGMELKDCRVNAVTNLGTVGAHRERQIPIAESALVALGTEARLEVELDIETEAGIMSVEAAIEP